MRIDREIRGTGMALRGRATFAAAVVAAAVTLLAGAASATAAQAPRWAVRLVTNPTNLPLSGGTGQVVLDVTNVGDAAADGSTITVADALPPSLTATHIAGYDSYRAGESEQGEAKGLYALIHGSGVSCTLATLQCTSTDPVDPGDVLTITIEVESTAASAGEEVDKVEVAGGGAEPVTAPEQLRFSEEAAPFGPQPGSVLAAISSSQAGAHPNLTTAFAMNLESNDGLPAYPKDIGFELPPGVVGNATWMPRCELKKVKEAGEEEHGQQNPSPCPADTVVGAAIVTLIAEPGTTFARISSTVQPVYNVAPAPGEPAAFGFFAGAFGVRIDTSVLSNGNYAVRAVSDDTSQSAGVLGVSITIWGVPADHSGPGQDHTLADAELRGLLSESTFGSTNASESRRPLLSGATQCSQPLKGSLSMNSWEDPGSYTAPVGIELGVPLGCEAISFRPELSMAPASSIASEPSEYTFDLALPQDEGPEELATSDVRDVVVKLPAGTVIDPSAATGLAGCTPSQFYGPERGTQTPASAGECPPESKIGKVEIVSPALREALQGSVYLGKPECDPCTPADAASGKMLRIYLEAYDDVEAHEHGQPSEGVLVKLEGHGEIDQRTGQVTTVFAEQPQVPVGHLKLSLFGGADAPLANPRACGTYGVNMEATPWSGTGTVSLESPFDIDEGCSVGGQFKPSFTAGTQNNVGGGYSAFTMGLSRQDADQYIGGVKITMPPGMAGMISKVSLCGEPQANDGTCPEASEIGRVSTLVGPGTQPYEIQGGKVYLTQGYGGAPFGLSIVVPATAGPYTLAGLDGEGREADNGVVVVRAKVEVDPHTAQVTIDSNPLPTSLDGIPLQIRRVKVEVDREGFMFNPTSCAKMAVDGTIGSAEGMSDSVTAPFQAAGCRGLPFKPSFKMLVHAKHSRKKGVYAHFVVKSGAGQANIGSVHVELPKILPSRESTLKQACDEQQFAKDPTGCPAGSKVGTAKAYTPVLPVPLEGTAIFVSHGGEAYPDLDIVLKGDNVTVVLTGSTHVNGKTGVTSSDFKTVPDVPISRFDLVLPAQSNSALGANGNLCFRTVVKKKRVRVRRHGKWVHRIKKVRHKVRRHLKMPTTLTGQNGAVVKHKTKVAVSGCGKKHKAKAKGASRHGRRRHAGRRHKR